MGGGAGGAGGAEGIVIAASNSGHVLFTQDPPCPYPQAIKIYSQSSILRQSNEMICPHVDAFNALIDEKVRKAASLTKAAALDKWRLRKDLGPICVDGNADAPVVYLQANPSYGDGATRASHYEPHPDFPLSVAGSHFAPATRDYYHNQVFKHLRKENVTLERISQAMMKVELCPWASKKWPDGRALQLALEQFPSRILIGQYVESLIQRGAIFIIARAWAPWFEAVPSLVPLIDVRVFMSRAPVSKYISSGTYPAGWGAIVSAMRG